MTESTAQHVRMTLPRKGASTTAQREPNMLVNSPAGSHWRCSRQSNMQSAPLHSLLRVARPTTTRQLPRTSRRICSCCFLLHTEHW